MAENLGELVVKISTDLQDLNRGLNEANQKVQDTANKIADSTKKMGLAFSLAGGAIVGALGLMVKSAVSYGDAIYEVSQRTGIATETLSTLKFVAEQTESSFEALSTGLRFLNRNMAEADSGTGQAKESFDLLGISVRDTTGKMKTADSVFFELADKISKVSDESQKTALAMQIFGRGGQQLLPVLNLGAQGIRELQQRARDLGLELNATNAKSIDQFSDKLKEAKEAVGGLWLNLSLKLLPILTSFVNRITDGLIFTQKWMKENEGLVRTLTEVSLALGVILSITGIILPIVGQLIIGFTNLTKAVIFLNSLTLFGLNTSVSVLSANLGVMYPVVVAVGTAFAAWEIGKFIGQIQQVKDFMTWVEAHLTPGGIQRQADQKVLEENQQQLQTSAKERNIDLSKLPNGENQTPGQAQLGQTGADNTGMDINALKLQQMKDFQITVDQMRMQDLINLQTVEDKKTQATKSQEEQRKNIITQGLAAKTALMQADKTNQLAALDFAGQMVQQFAGQSKAGFFILKAIKAAEILINTFAADMEIQARWAAVPPVAAALIANNHVLSAFSLAGVAAAAIAGFATGTDTVPAMLSPGEMVVPRTFADAIRTGDLTLGGRDSGISNNSSTVNVTVNAVIEYPVDIKKLADEIAFETNRELRYVR